VSKNETNQTEKETIKNENCAVIFEVKPGCQLEAKITLEPHVVKKCYNDALKIIKKKVALPGFRKGKAPSKMIISKFAPAINEEWKEITGHELLTHLFTATNKKPLSQNSVKSFNFENLDNDEAKATVVYEFYPDIPEIDVKSIKLPNIDSKPVEDKEIEDRICLILCTHGEKTEITDRAVQEDDILNITKSFIHPVDQQERKEEIPIIMRKRTADEKTFNSLIGKKINESFQFDTEDDDSEIHITVNKIESLNSTEITEDILSKINMETEDDLRKTISKVLSDEANEKAIDSLTEQLENHLAETYSFEVPESISSNVLATQKNDLERTHISSGIDADLAKKTAEADFEENKDLVSKNINRNLRLAYLFNNFADENSITVDDTDLMKAFQEAAQGSQEQFMKMISEDPKNFRDRMESNILQKKTREYILGLVTYDENAEKKDTKEESAEAIDS
jgi:trigger factor